MPLSNRELAEYVAGDGWLGAYLHYARPLTWAPSMYHVATGLTCLAVGCGSRVSWWDYGNKEVWPNIYVLLIGDTGMAKTTASNIGADMLRDALPGSILADNFTPESLIKCLVENPSSLIYAEEFGTLLASTTAKYNAGIKEMITQLYDPRQEYGIARSSREAGGNQTIYRPALSLLGGSTIVWLVQHLQEVDFQSGFMPRVLMFPQGDDDQEDPADHTKLGRAREDKQYRDLWSGLRRLGTMKHSATVLFEDKAWKQRGLWEGVLEGDAIIASNPDMRGLVKRLSSYAFKIATLLTVADYGAQEQYVVEFSTLKRATTLVEWLVRQTTDLFNRHIVFETFEKEAQALLRCIPDEGLSRQELLSISRTHYGEFDRMIKTLAQRGDIEQVHYQPPGSPKAVPYIRRIYRNTGPMALPFREPEIDDDEPPIVQEALNE